MKTILIAEDESAIREFVTINLRVAGYEVLEAENGKEAIDLFSENESKIDIALLDIMMPEMDGIEVCSEIRRLNANTGIIFLSAKTQEQDKILGLVSGADDYITKPFSTTELLARVEALFRRVEYSKMLLSASNSDKISLGDFTLDLKKHIIIKKGETIALTHIEFQILECFFSKPNETFGRKSILEKVWGDTYYGDEKVVDVNIRRLRIKLEDNPSDPKHLVSVWGQGYKWIV